MIVRESLDFEREGSPLKRLNIGILTWDKLKIGNILQNKKIVYPVMSRLHFSQSEDTLDVQSDVIPGKYWIIKTIRNDNSWIETTSPIFKTPGLEIELVWAANFRHALSMAERIKQPGNLAFIPKSYTANHSIEEWNDWFKIIQPKEYELEESVNFERGTDPKVSMDIGNKWTRVRPGNFIECIRTIIVEDKFNQDFLTFKDYIYGQYMGDRDYYFEPGNVAAIKQIVDFKEKAGLRITIIPFTSEKEARESIKKTDAESLSKVLYSTVKGTASISVWGKYFKVL